MFITVGNTSKYYVKNVLSSNYNIFLLRSALMARPSSQLTGVDHYSAATSPIFLSWASLMHKPLFMFLYNLVLKKLENISSLTLLIKLFLPFFQGAQAISVWSLPDVRTVMEEVIAKLCCNNYFIRMA